MTKSPTWLDFAHTTKPDIKLLKRILNSDDYNYYTTNQIKAVRLKYQALIAEPTIIEKTMSPAQLYASNSPLWANNYIGITIERILRQLEKKPRTEESFNNTISKLRINQPITFDEFHNIGANR